METIEPYSRCFVKVLVQDSVFSDEYEITLQTYNGSYVMLIAHRDYIIEKNGELFLQVMFLSRDHQRRTDRLLVELPVETTNKYETGTRWVEIKEEFIYYE